MVNVIYPMVNPMLHKLSDYRPISVLFMDEKYPNSKLSSNEISVALSQVAKEGHSISIDCRRQRFSAGSYFACCRDIPREDIVSTYVKKEQVCRNAASAKSFLNTVGRNPLKCRYIHLLTGVDECAQVVVLVVHAEQASRILGLSAYEGFYEVDVVPAAPTCAALFRPLIYPDSIHMNFIDYFDRQHQAIGSFKANEMLISMSRQIYVTLSEAYSHSAHGSFLPCNIPVYPSYSSDK